MASSTRRGFLFSVAGTGLATTVPGLLQPAHGAAAVPLVAAHPSAAAREWVATTYDLVLKENLSPPAAARAYAYAALAMYEALVPGMPTRVSLAGQVSGGLRSVRPDHRGAIDWPAALSTAVAAVLRNVLPFRAETTRPALDAAEAASIQARRSAGVPERTIAAGVEHGARVAAAFGPWIASDGHAGTVGRSYTPPAGEPFLWESTPPNFRPAVEPYWHEVRPLVLRAADEIAPAPHIPFDPDPSSPFGQQAMTTYRQSFANTDENRAISRFWTDNPGSFIPPLGTPTGLPAGHWMLIGAEGVRNRGVALDTAVETFAVLGIALHDAFLNCWTWKYRFNLLRPITYVRRYIDPAWNTFINTPQFPEYSSGHSVASPAAAAVLTAQLGSFAFTDNSHAPRGLPARSFASFRDAAAEAAQSRLYGGIHYPMAIAEGLVQGEAVGATVLSRIRTRR